MAKPKTIFDIVNATEISAYWESMTQDRPPFLGEVLFPAEQKLGLNLEWINGNSGLPVVLNLSGFDAQAIPREREGFSVTNTKMPFFKESTYVDEELRQQLNMALETGRQNYIDILTSKVFDDSTRLIEAARSQRERMRMSLLTTGAISIASNGQSVSYDYGVPNDHKATAAVSWATASTDIMADIRKWMDTVEDDTGIRPTRALCNQSVWNYMLKNTGIRNTIFVYSSGVSVVSNNALKAFLMDQLELSVFVNNKRYKSESKATVKYVADDVFVLLPPTTLGKSWFGTTPEQSDLMNGSAANVAIVDTGVAVTTSKKVDPVNVETKVSQIFLPSFEAVNEIFIADTTT